MSKELKAETKEERVSRVMGLLFHLVENIEKMKSCNLSVDKSGKIKGIGLEKINSKGEYCAGWGVIIADDGSLDVYSNGLMGD